MLEIEYTGGGGTCVTDGIAKDRSNPNDTKPKVVRMNPAKPEPEPEPEVDFEEKYYEMRRKYRHLERDYNTLWKWFKIVAASAIIAIIWVMVIGGLYASLLSKALSIIP